MSRKGKLPIAIPHNVEVKLAGNTVSVKGPKGTLTQDVNEYVNIEIKDHQVFVTLEEKHAAKNNFQGLYRALIDNMVEGTTKGFEKKLQMIGVGYRATVKGTILDLQLGFSHPSEVVIPEGISIKVDKNTLITITGIDKRQVGQFAADVRSIRPPEPYQGKGVRYEQEYVRRKAGKAASSK